MVEDDETNSANDSDDATVTFTDALPSLDVTKAASPTSVAEPGGTVTFTVIVDNTSVEPITITSLTDDVFGDLLDAGNPNVSSNTCPAVGSSSRMIVLASVDLPQPDSPTTASVSPRPTWRSTFTTAWTDAWSAAGNCL